MSIQVHRIVNQPIDSNCFVVEGDIDNRSIVIDPGTEDCGELLSFLKERSLVVQFIFLTHEHMDHISGCRVLKEKYPDSQLICSDLCAQNINDTRFNLSRLADQYTPRNCFPKPEMTFDSVMCVEWQAENVFLFKAMGHSRGSSIVLIKDNLFVGDTFIYQNKTTSTLPGSSKKELIKTFESLINNEFGIVNVVYPGHFEMCSVVNMKEELNQQVEKLKKIIAARQSCVEYHS